MPDLKHSEGHLYLKKTRFDRHTLDEQIRLRIEPTEVFKTYPAAEQVPLPTPSSAQFPADFWQLLQQRRSSRKFSETPLTLEELSLLFWACQGITGQAGNWLFRTAPSAGALYPIETYVAVDKVDGLAPGLFHFSVRDFVLERLLTNPVGEQVAEACLKQRFLSRGAVIFIWSAVMRRNMAKYGHRGGRYILMDAAHICQNLLLAAEAIGRKSCPVGAFFDDELNQLLGLDDEEESVLYLAVVG